MLNLKDELVSALATATALTTLISDRLFFQYPSSFNALPCISYYQVDNIPSLYTDDIEAGSEIVFRVDLWSKASLTEIAGIVDGLLVAKEYTRRGCPDLYEKDTGIYHTAMTYAKSAYAT